QPASASPEVILPNTSATWCSRESAVISRPLDSMIDSETVPQGTCGSQSTKVLSSVMSSIELMLPGLPEGTTMTITFDANWTGSLTTPASCASFMFFSSAVINTSPGAPSTSC